MAAVASSPSFSVPTGRVLILVNGSADGAPAERARWVARAAGPETTIAHRSSGLGRTLSGFQAALRATRPRLVYLIDTGIATVLAGARARTLGAHVVLDTGDATAALTRTTGRLGLLGAVGAPAFERAAYRLASIVVARSEALAAHARQRGARRVIVGPDGYDPALVDNGRGDAERARWAAGDRLTVGVVGSAHWNARRRWCYGRDVIEMLAGARRRDVLGVLLVQGDGVPHLRALARARGVAECLVIEDDGDAAQTWRRLSALDVALSTQTDDVVGRVRTTGKLVQYMAAGRFVLASRVGAAAALLPDEMLVDYHGAWDEGYFARLAARLDALPDRRVLAGQGARLRARAEPFAYPRLVQTLSAGVFAEL
jgi:glycosyltransferase involved in cell wall biosynthesis